MLLYSNLLRYIGVRKTVEVASTQSTPKWKKMGYHLSPPRYLFSFVHNNLVLTPNSKEKSRKKEKRKKKLPTNKNLNFPPLFFP